MLDAPPCHLSPTLDADDWPEALAGSLPEVLGLALVAVFEFVVGFVVEFVVGFVASVGRADGLLGE